MVTMYNDIMAFFDVLVKAIVGKAVGFIVVFSAVYLWIFISFFATLKEEIWLTHEILKLIPICVLESNLKVREEVLKRRSVK